jgi:hypothetical protein
MVMLPMLPLFLRQKFPWPARLAFSAASVLPLMALCALALVELGIHWALTSIYICFGTFVLLTTCTIAGITGLSLLSIIIGFLPGGPLMLSGFLFPGAGALGIGLTLLLFSAVEFSRKHRHKAAVAATGLVLTLIANFQFDGRQQEAPTQIDTIVLEHNGRPGGYSEKHEIAKIAEAAEAIILGENTITPGQLDELDYWCGISRQTGAEIYVGVQSSVGAGDMWRASSETCPDLVPIYRPTMIVPGVNGTSFNPLANKGAIYYRTTSGGSFNLQWVACFEAFSVLRWALMSIGSDNSTVAVVYSNTTWAHSLPADSLLKRISKSLSRIPGVPVVHAEKHQSVIKVRKKNND